MQPDRIQISQDYLLSGVLSGVLRSLESRYTLVQTADILQFRKQIYFLRNAGSDWWVKSTGHHTTNPGRSKSSCSTSVLSSPYRCPFVSVWRYFYFAFYGEKLQQSYLGCQFHFGFWPPAIPLPFQTLKEMVQASTRIQHQQSCQFTQCNLD